MPRVAVGALVAAVPLVALPSGGLGFLPEKWLLVAVAVPLGLAFSLPERRPPAAAAWGALLGVLAIAAATGVAPQAGLLGAPQRHLGWIAWLTFAGSWVLGHELGTRPADRTWVIRAAVAASLPVSAVGLLQLAGWDRIGLQVGLADRVGSTWGSAPLLGAHLVVVLPLAWHLTRNDPDPRWRAVSGGALVAGLGALIATGSRSTWLGAAVAAILLVAPALRAGGRRSALLAGATLVVIALVLAATRPDDLTRSTAGGRLDQWGLTVELVVDRPILGSGPDTYRIVFPAVIDDQFERDHAADVVNDRAHQLVLDTAVSAGLTGVAALGALILVVARRLRRELHRPLVRAVAAAGLGYLVHLGFAFQDANLDALVWLVLGVGAGCATSGSGPAESGRVRAGRGARRHPAPAPAIRPTGAVARAALVGLAALALVWAGRGVIADQRLGRGIDAAEAGRLDDALTSLRSGRDLEPERVHHHEAIARTARAAAAASGDPVLASEAVEAADAALDRLPGDPALLLDRAEALLNQGRAADAAAAFADVLDGRYPRSFRAHLGAGSAAASLHDLATAEARWRTAAELDRSDPAPLLNLGLLYERTGDEDEARAAYAEALRRDPDRPDARTALERLASR